MTIMNFQAVPYFIDKTQIVAGWSDFCDYAMISKDTIYPLINETAPNVYSWEQYADLLTKANHNPDEILSKVKKQTEACGRFKLIEVQLLKNEYCGAYQYSIASRVLFDQKYELDLISMDRFPCEGKFSYFPNELLATISNKKIYGRNKSRLVGDLTPDDMGKLITSMSFALPPPWGAFVMTGIQLITMLFGGNSNAKMFQNMIKAIVKEVAEVIEDEDDKTMIINVQTFNYRFSEILAVLQGDPENIDYIEKTVIPILDNALDPSNPASVVQSLAQIVAKGYGLPKTTSDYLGLLSYQFIGATSFTIVLIYKIKLQLLALIASVAKNKNNDEDFKKYTALWLGTFEELHIHVFGSKDGGLKPLKELMTSVRTRAVARRNSYVYFTTPGLQERTSEDPCTFELMRGQLYDSFRGIACLRKYIQCDPGIDLSAKGDGLNPEYKNNKLREWADQYRREQYGNTVALLDRTCDMGSFATKIEASISVWVAKLKPIAPTENDMKIEFKSSGVKTTEGVWVKNKQVRYRINFVNTVGTAQSPWTHYVPVTYEVEPFLTDIPTDHHFLTRVRQIERQFKGENSDIIHIIPNNTDTQIQDTF